MNIPYWLLRMLPMWEYICPKCRKGVKQSAHQCPHCSEKFPLAIRVPPSFLKDPKKLEAYVHKHIFPRVSEFERNYLTKYFTVIFPAPPTEPPEGFESGDFSAWTGTGGTISVVTDYAHHGTYSAKSESPAWGAGLVYKSWGGSYTTVFARVYQKFNNLISTGVAELITLRGASFIIAIAEMVYVDGTTSKWRIKYRNGGALSTTSLSTETISTGTPYSIELKAVKSATIGEVRLFIGGTEVLS